MVRQGFQYLTKMVLVLSKMVLVLVLSIDPILRVGIGIGIDSIPRLRSSIEFLEACLSRLKTNFIA